MDTVKLKPDLHERLAQDAVQEARTVDDLVNEAVEHYLLERQRAKIERETAAFEALYPQLREQFLGEWVAFHNQKLVDHDTDRSALYQRVRKAYGKISVLIRQVTEQYNDEIWIRTPSTGKVEP
ncbi:MAG: DUF5678 domain-containing protein [Chloroflexi bacterium]|nr:DUF5678 domain-containing protein [Chloroflexota bacterium]MCI0647020.1 DUF5678 domain-containing protein [Chloroflexota bacterium]MCI0730720.1 DUF5678 domain-containing protein [Chloroflexota bacterium]